MKKDRLFFIAATAIMVMLTFCAFLYVWLSPEPLPISSAPTTATNQVQKININTADAAELETLPGIGPKLAQAIIDYRNKHGNFHTVSDLIKVSGIGDGKLSKIADLITVGG